MEGAGQTHTLHGTGEATPNYTPASSFLKNKNMILQIHEPSKPDGFTDFLLRRIHEHLKAHELCVLMEKNAKEGTPDSILITHNSQAACLFDMAYELNLVLEEYLSTFK